MELVKISEIIVKNRKRPADNIDELVNSIQEIGLINPVTISKDNVLIAGYHRIEACKKLGWEKIPATIADLSELKSELAEIDENLIRKELTALQNAEQLQRRKEIYETLYPESTEKNRKKLGAEKTNNKTASEMISPASFVKDTAKKTGKSERSIQQDIQIASNLPEEVKVEIKNSKIEDNKTDLLELAKIKEPEKQLEIIEQVKNGQVKNVKSAINAEKENITESEKQIIIDVEFYEKLKFAYEELEHENNELKNKYNQLLEENENLKLEIQRLKQSEKLDIVTKSENVKKAENISNTERLTEPRKNVSMHGTLYKENCSIISNGWELPFPPAFELKDQPIHLLLQIAENYCKNKFNFTGQ